ncbi:hypothetical protein EB796_021553 [Bugula neritina]|uniref:Vesicular, overexpressed in cancer, prosurvival protein 1 n=1 Tax=Bugula neritina TaxID=10212 RepID=A0A7J7J383_BUGNE|nr:hypothetical protein EB796_021553 [Bugula neritina]
MVDRHLHCLASWLTILLQTHSVYGYYCDNDRCDFDEYCCGHNICCTSYNVWQMWYFWLGLVIFLILLAGCFSFWRYRYQQALVVQMCLTQATTPLCLPHRSTFLTCHLCAHWVRIIFSFKYSMVFYCLNMLLLLLAWLTFGCCLTTFFYFKLVLE